MLYSRFFRFDIYLTVKSSVLALPYTKIDTLKATIIIGQRPWAREASRMAEHSGGNQNFLYHRRHRLIDYINID